ncbi:hypothetical protein ACFQS1_26535 [Paractinoplanes rhizophilus]|uniref:Uncharacterized protein n=1 Tax=Paractinoplanes rhizophilus TaxID=1416877 RepID=A0ABW2HWQ9_9ACTN
MNVQTGPVSPSVSRWLRFSAWLGRTWRAFLALFSPPEPEPVSPAPPPPPPPPPPPGRLSGRRSPQRPMVVPASGYIFTFLVHATFIWGSDGLYQDELNSSIEGLMPYATRRLKALAAQHARQYPPHRARELELALQEDLRENGPWKLHWRGADLTCQPYAWVELDEQVKQAVQPYWEQLIKLDCEHDVQMRRAEYAETLSKQWTAILTELVGSPVADGAAEMTEKELAEVVRKIVAEQKAASEKLEDLMAKKVEDGDTFERSDHFTALRERLERRADRLFERPGADSADGHQPPG